MKREKIVGWQGGLRETCASLKRLFGLNWPIVISVGGRFLNTLFVPLTIMFICRRLNPAEQGYYYTFSSMFALQGLLELGFLSCLSHVASHHSRGDIGFASHEHHDIQLLVCYGVSYACGLALVVFFAVGIIGSLLMSSARDGVAPWWPWWAFVTVSCINIGISPVMAILDGCNAVSFTSAVRVCGMIANNIALCIALAAGAGLFSLAIGSAAMVAVIASSLVIRFRHLLRDLLRNTRVAFSRWNSKILPFQGKIAVTTICNYALGALFTPILLSFSGAEAAGRFGMSLQLMNSIGAIALVWTTTKTGVYGRLAQAKDLNPLERLFYRTTLQGAFVALLGVVALFGAYVFVGSQYQAFSRMLPLRETIPLAWPVIVIQFTVAATSLFRAFGEERLLWSVMTHALLHVMLLFWLVPSLGAVGAVWSQVISYSFGLLCAIAVFRRFRLEKFRTQHA